MKLKNKLSSEDYFLVLSMTFVVIAVSMNIFCMKSLSFGTPIILCDGGLLISWIVFLISNVIVEVWGKERSVKVVTFTAFISLFILVLGRLIVFIPSLPEYEEQVKSFENIFSNGPRTIMASVVAFWTGNFINVSIIAKLIKKNADKDNGFLFFFRAVISTLFGQFVDNALFTVLAFAPIGLSVYEMRWVDIYSSVVSSTVIEMVVEACFVPLVTIPLTKRIKNIIVSEKAA